jgi:hypothetical protein
LTILFGSNRMVPRTIARAETLPASRSTMASGPADQPPQSGTSPSDAELRSRLAQAEVVVSGVVSATAQVSAPRPPLSEHDPDWWRATVNVESVEKGQVATKTIAALFAASTDVAWYRSPKLKTGDHGVLVLHRKDSSGRPLPDLAVVDPLDVRPIAELDRVRSLLKAGTP